jgi:hypothetical protein
MNRWLAYLGYIFSWIIFCLHAVYIGNDLLYKVDNLLILAQTFYFFQFVNLLTGNYLSQFYYGWRWAHGGFFPNFFEATIPEGYFARGAPEPYKLISLDANFLRNAGFSFSLLLVFLVVWLVVSALVYLIFRVCKRRDVYYGRVMKNALIAGIEFFAMNIFYWAIAFLKYEEDIVNYDDSFYTANKIAACVLIAVISVYAFIRFCFNKIGGLYMFKRLIIAAILAAAVYDKPGYVGFILGLEFLFMVLRFIIERPKTRCEKIYIVIEWLLFSIAYILMFLV